MTMDSTTSLMVKPRRSRARSALTALLGTLECCSGAARAVQAGLASAPELGVRGVAPAAAGVFPALRALDMEVAKGSKRKLRGRGVGGG